MTDPTIDKAALEAALGRAADFLVGVNMQSGTSVEYRALAAQSHVAVKDAIALIRALPPTTDGVTRKTFVVPDGFEAVLDHNGRATGEVRPVVAAWLWQEIDGPHNLRFVTTDALIADKAKSEGHRVAPLYASPTTSPQAPEGHPIEDGEGWQDISTAPKDGNHVLIASSWLRPHVELARWIGAPHNHWSVDGFRYVDKPTHWRPLPAAPSDPGTKVENSRST